MFKPPLPLLNAVLIRRGGMFHGMGRSWGLLTASALVDNNFADGELYCLFGSAMRCICKNYNGKCKIRVTNDLTSSPLFPAGQQHIMNSENIIY